MITSTSWATRSKPGAMGPQPLNAAAPPTDDTAARSACSSRWQVASTVTSRPRKNRLSASHATRRRSSSAVSPLRNRASPSSVNSSATSVSMSDTPRPMLSARSRDDSINLGVSVSSARSKPGSTPASSGNSCSSDRQNASMVLMEMSPKASRISRQRSPLRLPRRWRSRNVAMTRCRISAAALRVKVIARMLRGATPTSSRRT